MVWRLLGVFSLGVIAALVWQSAPVVVIEEANTASSVFNLANNDDLPRDNAEHAQSEREREQARITQVANTLQQLLAAAKQDGQGNLQAWLEKIWRQCQAQGPAACAALQAQLAQTLNAEEQQWLRDALVNFDHYQQDMRELTLSTDTPVQERYEALKQLRERYLGEQSPTVFGREENFATYQFNYEALYKNSSSLDVEHRLQQLERLQQQLKLGADSESLLGPDTKYQHALGLLRDLPAAQQAQWREQLRLRYFGDRAQEVAAYELRQQQQQAQQQTYQQALQTLNRRWQQQPNGLNSVGYQQELQALRAQLFN